MAAAPGHYDVTCETCGDLIRLATTLQTNMERIGGSLTYGMTISTAPLVEHWEKAHGPLDYSGSPARVSVSGIGLLFRHRRAA